MEGKDLNLKNFGQSFLKFKCYAWLQHRIDLRQQYPRDKTDTIELGKGLVLKIINAVSKGSRGKTSSSHNIA